MSANSTGAGSWIVAGQDAPPEDARISSAFGPARETAGGIEIPVLDSRPRHGAAVPVGVLRIAEGRVAFHPAPLPGRRAAQRVLFFWILVWIAWLWRRVRSYE
jgi:hypothetical protein